MKKQLLLVMLSAFVLITTLLTPQVQAANLQFLSPLNPGAHVVKFKGDTASATFSQTTDGCIYTDANVFASESTYQSSPGAPQSGKWVNINISRYDTCSWTWISGAYGYAPLDGNNFQIDKQLNSARLQTTVPMTDWNSGASFNVTVDLTWSGAGELARGKSQYQYESPGCKYKTRWNGSSRLATTTGSMSDGSTNYASGSSIYAYLQSAKNGDLSIGCGW